MKRSDFNARFRGFARDHLSPTTIAREFVSRVYGSVQDVLGSACLQIGSYPRFTSIRPLHDLDVLYILGAWDPARHDPSEALSDLEARLRAGYKNPTKYVTEVSRQNHSITIKFKEGESEIFSVDIVPAYTSGQNEFGDPTYVVPEIAGQSRTDRRRTLEAVAKGRHQMVWIRSDPRGYITVASRLNEANEDFRRAVKIVKRWRSSCKTANDDFPLKSFHLEQCVTRIFLEDPQIAVFGAVFRFFVGLPDFIRHPQIPDRADARRNIDGYVEQLGHAERRRIDNARDFFLIQLEESNGDMNQLVTAGWHQRKSDKEAYLFDQKIPMLTEGEFSIVATALERTGGFRRRILDAMGLIEINRRIEFRLGHNAPRADLFKWKVKNDDSCSQPRGEITDHRTLRDPEETKYNGQHHVECFAIQNNVCIGRSRQNVVLRSSFVAG